MDLEFKPGDRVKLTPSGACYYGGNPKWIPPSQGAGTEGTVLVAADRPHDPRAASRPYYIRWDNGAENSYRVEDLQAAIESQPEPNIVAFKR